MSDSMTKRTGRTLDMTQGRPVKIIFIFAIPLFLGILLQQLYNVVDTAIAGSYCSHGRWFPVSDIRQYASANRRCGFCVLSM